MVQDFARHEVNKGANNFGNDDSLAADYVTRLLWGGDAGCNWAKNLKEKFDENG